MPIELVAPPDNEGVRMLSSRIKSSNAEQVVEVGDKKLKARVIELALNVFYALGARD
jgi:hypothetical protein